MSRIIAVVLRVGGAVGGVFAGLQMPPDILMDLLADVGIGAEAGLTPVTAGVALALLGGVFGFLFGTAVAGILPGEMAEPVGTREEAAASVPRLRRHLAENQGKTSRTGTPLERLSAPPAGQQLPKHDLSHIPPAPKDDEITFDRIPNTGFYADIESPVRFDEDDDDLARFATVPDDAPAAEFMDEAGDEEPVVTARDDHADDPEFVERDHVDAELVRDGAASCDEVEQALGAGDWADTGDWAPATDMPPQDRSEAGQNPVHPGFEPAPVQIQSLCRDTGHDGHSAPRFAPGLTGGMEADWFAGEADEEEDADDDGAGYGSLMAIGLGKTHKPRAQPATPRPGEANLSPMPLLDIDRGRDIIPNGAGPQDFRLREALEELKRV